jgi:hypothetical protein
LIVLAVSVALAGDVIVWSGHVLWRDRALEALDPVLEQIEALAEAVAADDAWISKNQRLLQGYGQHEELARRMTERGRRSRVHAALVEAYNGRVERIYRRFYLAPVPAPRPPVVGLDPTRDEGKSPTR